MGAAGSAFRKTMPGTLRTDVLVVGGGPAGLSAAAACRARRCDYLLIEAGNRVGLRNHNVQRSLGSGVGGSGLYSDGKFSFFPSASALWSLRDHRALEESWRWFASLVAGFDVEADTLPDLAALPAIPLINGAGSNPFDRKEYRSAYMSYAARRRLIECLRLDADKRSSRLTNSILCVTNPKTCCFAATCAAKMSPVPIASMLGP